ncbi:MAG: helix-turn-helix domain containing protein [Rhodovulum sulfidophilum]|uniref:Helix-turn-helix domain containing protein n=1 Tax=Rhodovulum sulfidophilum TaxID=35806 RepID=A0A2W5PWM0_RHOSU|nr:MAG: helix-turn-helix domain containing protein [Rhodovulum sulfidophilum]
MWTRSPSDPDRDHPPAARDDLPAWLPDHAVTYLDHVARGHTLRALARGKGCHASTVLRQVRRVEAWREDPLVDEALDRLGRLHAHTDPEETTAMRHSALETADAADAHAPGDKVAQEARRILRRLCEKGAFLAVAPNMEKAVVLREVVPGKQNRIAVVDREIAHAFALQEWIACERPGKVSCYAITMVGRAALKRLLLEDRDKREQRGFAEAQSPFQGQHRYFAERSVMADDGSGARRLRFNLAESPLSVLGRKRDKDGIAYLTPELIEAGERLREDFELAGMGPRVTQNWERFLTAGASRGSGAPHDGAEGPSDARTRVARAMEALGPGLSDIVFRICCFLEGLETAEKRLGWSARSGKVVLKIALERLAAHYGVPPRDRRAAG